MRGTVIRTSRNQKEEVKGLCTDKGGSNPRENIAHSWLNHQNRK